MVRKTFLILPAFLLCLIAGAQETGLNKSLFTRNHIRAGKLLDKQAQKGDYSQLPQLAFTYSRLHQKQNAIKYYIQADGRNSVFTIEQMADFYNLIRSENLGTELKNKYEGLLRKQGYTDVQPTADSWETEQILSMCFNTSGDEFGYLNTPAYEIVSSNINHLQKDIENAVIKSYIVKPGCVYQPLSFSTLPAIDSKIHQGPSYVSPDLNWVFMTVSRNKPNAQGIHNLDVIFTYKLGLYEYAPFHTLPFSNESYSIQHPWFDPVSQTLYFSSNKPGGKGGFDLYNISWVNGQWSEPKPLERVNTAADEVFPFLADDGRLFYSSNPVNGFGGLDILVLDKDHQQTSLLPRPINSAWDDFGLSLKDPNNGWFVSNREGGRGGDDVYQFKLKTLPYLITVIVYDSLTGRRINGAELRAREGNAQNLLTDNKGEVKIEFPANSTGMTIPLSYLAHKEGYPDTAWTNKVKLGAEHQFTFRIPMLTPPGVLPVQQLKLGDDLGKILQLNPIYFKLDKWDITPKASVELDKVVKALNDYPTLEIELGSHTDSRASNKYNLRLSQHRAESSAAYLISKGIDPHRLTMVGYGEEKLTNNCSDGVPCSNKDHALNRRTEFIIIKL